MSRRFTAAVALCLFVFAGCERPAKPAPPLAVWNADLESPEFLKELAGREIVMRTPMVVRFVDTTSEVVNKKEVTYDLHGLHSLDEKYIIKARSPKLDHPDELGKRLADGTYFVRGVVTQQEDKFILTELACSVSPFSEINAVEFNTRPADPKNPAPAVVRPKRFDGPELRSTAVLDMLLNQRIEFPAVVKRHGTEGSEGTYELAGQDGMPIITGISPTPIPNGEWWVSGTVNQDVHGYRLVNLERVEIVTRAPLRPVWKK